MSSNEQFIKLRVFYAGLSNKETNVAKAVNTMIQNLQKLQKPTKSAAKTRTVTRSVTPSASPSKTPSERGGKKNRRTKSKK